MAKVASYNFPKQVIYPKIPLISEFNNTKKMLLEITRLLVRFLPQIDFKLIFNNQLTIEFFKDHLLNVLQGCIVYKFSCGQLATCRHAFENMMKYLLGLAKPY